MVGEGPSMSWSLPSLWGWRENARGRKGNAQQSTGHFTSICSGGISWDFTRGHRRGAEAGLEEESTGWFERNVRRGKGAANELPAFVSREREMSVHVCLDWPSSVKRWHAVTQGRYGQRWAPTTASSSRICWKVTSHFTPANLNTSQIFSLFQPRICLRTRYPCHSIPLHFYLSFQYVV